MTTRGRASALMLALAGWVAACGAATPSQQPPSLGDPVTSAARPSATPSLAASPRAVRPSPGASREPAGDLGRELEVWSLDPAWTHPMLEFASTGDAIIFSSGVADGPNVEYAPDLWRYDPAAPEPELLWQNPQRDRVLARIGGEFDTVAFVDMPVTGERAWDFWLLPEAGADPILLDTHPGDESVPDFIPSFSIHQDQVAWTSFDRGSSGAVSQLLYARAPEWQPVIVAERDAAMSELWLPSLRDTQIAYCEIVYSADRSTDERHVYLADAAHPEIAPRRLDASGRATMPLLMLNGGVVWKEADPGFSMFNWGKLFRYDEATDEVTSIPMRPQEYVNYPSAGTRFIAAWGAESGVFGVYDRDVRASRLIDRWPSATDVAILRPHISGDLLVWLHAEGDGLGAGPLPEIRYAYLPPAGGDRGGD